MIFDAQLGTDFWTEAINMASYVINRCVNSVLKNRMSKEVWSGEKVDLCNIRIFGTNHDANPETKAKKMG